MNLDVLVVEDNEGIRELYKTALGAGGLSVLTADDGEPGVALALEHRPRVILMDILMPKMSGHEAVARIRKDDWGKNARIIYLTNLSDPENVVKAIGQNPEEFIVKANAEVKDVVNKVRAAMHTPK